MPHSDSSNIPWVQWALEEVVKPKTVLDIGAGAGKYGNLVRQYSEKNYQDAKEVYIDAVEIWEPYIDQFGLHEIYDEVFRGDVRLRDDFEYDLVILGDVLEHMTEAEALALWEKISSQAKYAIISIPIIHYPQDAHEGNPYEMHVDENWTHERVMATFSYITGYRTFDITGIYIAEFK